MAPAIKENTGSRTVVSQRQVLLCGIVVLCVLVGISMSREASLEKQDDISSWKRKKAKSPTIIVKPPKKVKRNKDGYRMCLLHTDENLGGLPIELGQDPVKMNHDDTPLPIRYQCAGMAYNQFATKLEELVRNKVKEEESASASNHWGQRDQPIPIAPFEEPRNILFFGSSHLRQVLAALLCQYNDKVISVRRIHGTEKLYSLNSFALKIVLKQNIFIYAIINPSFVYTTNWQDLFENHVLDMPLEMMDLIITNPLHHFHKNYGQTFLEFLHDHGETHSTQSEGMTVRDDPPSFLDLTRAYDGRIIYVGSFAEYGHDHLELVLDQINALERGQIPPSGHELKTGQTHEIDWEFATTAAAGGGGSGGGAPKGGSSITTTTSSHANGAISKQAESMFTYKPPPPKIKKAHYGGRRRRRLEEEEGAKAEAEEQDNAEALEEEESEQEEVSTTTRPPRTTRTNLLAIDGRKYTTVLGECSTDTHKTIHTCITNTTHPRYNQGHKCFGSRGGHPDLISYDLIEGIYQLFLH